MTNFHVVSGFRMIIRPIMFFLVSLFILGCGENSKTNLNKFDAYSEFNIYLDSLSSKYSKIKSEDSIAINNINGIKQEGYNFYNSEGYNIDFEIMDKPLNEVTLIEIKDKYSINSEYIVDNIRSGYLCYSMSEFNDSINVSTINYVIELPNYKTAIVAYKTMVSRNKRFEQKFNELVIQDSIPNECYTNMEVDSVKFAGRFIKLGLSCEWQGVNNIQCNRMGQMNWSEFQDISRAIEMIRNQIILTNQKYKIEKVELVDITFEGNQTKALRMHYKFKLPKILLGGSNTLIAYYLVSEVRNRYVACILSHYDDEAKEGQLPPLLSEVMKLGIN
jgi:hypothetical protein